MDLDEMTYALKLLEQTIDALEGAGEIGLADKSRALLDDALHRYEQEGGDRSMFDAALA